MNQRWLWGHCLFLKWFLKWIHTFHVYSLKYTLRSKGVIEPFSPLRRTFPLESPKKCSVILENKIVLYHIFGIIFDVFGTIFGSLENLWGFSWEDNCRTFLELFFLVWYTDWRIVSSMVLKFPNREILKSGRCSRVVFHEATGSNHSFWHLYFWLASSHYKYTQRGLLHLWKLYPTECKYSNLPTSSMSFR